MAYSLLISTFQVLSTTGSTTGIDTTGADLLVAAVMWRSDSATEPTLSDSKGNTWTPLTSRVSSASGVRLYYCQGGTVGLGHTFTLTGTGTFQGTIHVGAFSGSGPSPFDKQAGAVTSTDASMIQPGSITPAADAELIVSAIAARWWTDGITVRSPMTMISTTIGEGGVSTSSAFTYQIQTTATAVNPTYDWSNAGDAAAVVAAFAIATPGLSGTGIGQFGALSTTATGFMDQVGTGDSVFGPLAASGSDTNTPTADGVGTFGLLAATGSGTASSPGYAFLVATQAATVVSGSTPPINTTGADLIVINTTQYADSDKAVLTDSYANTWQHLTLKTGPGAYDRLHYLQGGTVGPGHTFTLTATGSFYGSLQVAAFRGSPPSPFQSENGFETQSVTSIKAGPVAPTQGGALIVAGVQTADSTSALTIDSGFTVPPGGLTTPASGITSGGAIAYLFQGAATPVNPQWSWTGTGWDQAAVIAVFAGTITENFVNATGQFGALAADGIGGMVATGTGVGAFGALSAVANGGMVGDGSGAGVFGPLAAEGIGASAPVIGIGAGSFGPLASVGAGFMQAIVNVFTVNTTAKAYLLSSTTHRLVMHQVPGTGPAPAAYPLVATISYNGSIYEYREDSGTVLDNYVDPAGRFTQRCIAARNPFLPEMLVFFRPDTTGTRAEVIFELGDVFADNSVGGPFNNAHMTAYTVTIARLDGTVLYTATIPAHYRYSRWRWQSAPRPVTVTPAALIAAKLVPNYNASVSQGLSPSQSPSTYTPMGLAGQNEVMYAGGGGEEIGPVTTHQADWLINQGAASLSSMMAQAESAGTWPWHFRDKATNAPLNGTTYPKASMSPNNGPTPYFPESHALDMSYPSGIRNLIWDSAHQPALNYVPFLLTGDPYYLEGLQFQVGANMFGLAWDDRHNHNSWGAIRAHAWSLRTDASAVLVTPDTVPNWLLPKSYYTAWLEDNRQWCLDTFVNGIGTQRTVIRTMELDYGNNDESPAGPAGTYAQPYMEGYEGIVIGWVARNFPAWLPVHTWKTGSVIARTNGTSGWIRAYVSPYRQNLRATTASPFLDWAGSWSLTQSRYGLTYTDSNTSVEHGDVTYTSIARADLAQAVTNGVSGALTCYNWLDGQLTTNMHSPGGGAISYQWCIAP